MTSFYFTWVFAYGSSHKTGLFGLSAWTTYLCSLSLRQRGGKTSKCTISVLFNHQSVRWRDQSHMMTALIFCHIGRYDWSSSLSHSASVCLTKTAVCCSLVEVGGEHEFIRCIYRFRWHVENRFGNIFCVFDKTTPVVKKKKKSLSWHKLVTIMVWLHDPVYFIWPKITRSHCSASIKLKTLPKDSI